MFCPRFIVLLQMVEVVCGVTVVWAMFPPGRMGVILVWMDGIGGWLFGGCGWLGDACVRPRVFDKISTGHKVPT